MVFSSQVAPAPAAPRRSVLTLYTHNITLYVYTHIKEPRGAAGAAIRETGGGVHARSTAHGQSCRTRTDAMGALLSCAARSVAGSAV